MAVYAAALSAADDSESVAGLKETYEEAAGLAQQACGTGYVQNAESSTSGALGVRLGGIRGLAVALGAGLVALGVGMF